MFEKELGELTHRDKQRIEKMLETATRDVISQLDAQHLDPLQIVSKCATLRAVFKLAAILRQDTAPR